jgi:hypothetical protein
MSKAMTRSWILLRSKGMAELLVFSGCRCNQLDRGLKETV